MNSPLVLCLVQITRKSIPHFVIGPLLNLHVMSLSLRARHLRRAQMDVLDALFGIRVALGRFRSLFNAAPPVIWIGQGRIHLILRKGAVADWRPWTHGGCSPAPTAQSGAHCLGKLNLQDRQASVSRLPVWLARHSVHVAGGVPTSKALQGVLGRNPRHLKCFFAELLMKVFQHRVGQDGKPALAVGLGVRKQVCDMVCQVVEIVAVEHAANA